MIQVRTTDVLTLNILRGAQGIGAAAQIPASVRSVQSNDQAFWLYLMKSLQLGILADAFPPSRARRIAFATFSTGAAVGAVFGTAVSGALSESTRSVILLNPLIAYLLTIVIVKRGDLLATF
jgi:hypothetical protein